MIHLLLALLQSSGSISPPSGQAIAVPPVKLCQVFDASPAGLTTGQAGMLIAICGGKGAPIGAASSYSVVVNPKTGIAVIVRQRGLKTQVLLASPTKTGTAIDDITRDLARLAGRFSDLGLGPANVDASQFAISGAIGVVLNGSTKWLDTKSYTARAATLIPASP